MCHHTSTPRRAVCQTTPFVSPPPPRGLHVRACRAVGGKVNKYHDDDGDNDDSSFTPGLNNQRLSRGERRAFGIFVLSYFIYSIRVMLCNKNLRTEDSPWPWVSDNKRDIIMGSYIIRGLVSVNLIQTPLGTNVKRANKSVIITLP